MCKETNAPAVLRPTPIRSMPVPELLASVGKICDAGAACPEIQASQPAKLALGRVRRALATATASQARKVSLASSLETAKKALAADYTVVGTSLRTYENMVDTIACGDAAVIHEAGLASTKDEPVTVATPRTVTGLRGKPGRRAAEAVLSWEGARGATGYVVQVNATPGDATAWGALDAGNRYTHRTVKGPHPGAKLLVRVAALGRDGARAEWSEPVLVTAC